MAVSRQEVLQVAALARLRLTAEEVDRFTAQLNDILAHVEELSVVDVSGVEGVSGATDRVAPLRTEDHPPDALRRPVAENAPAWEDGFFTVPRLPALDAGDLEDAFEDKARLDPAGRPEPESLSGGGQ